MLNRRSFLKSSATAIVALPFASTLLVGCSSADLKNYLNVALDSLVSILSLTNSTDSWYAGLVSAINALKATEGTWTAGTVTADIEAALKTAEAVLAVIPVTAAYSPLIDLVVTAIDTILSLFVKPSPAVSVKAKTSNPHRNRVSLKKPGTLQSKIEAYRQQYNDIVVGLQLPATAKI